VHVEVDQAGLVEEADGRLELLVDPLDGGCAAVLGDPLLQPGVHRGGPVLH
jgi:hypothetical protein